MAKKINNTMVSTEENVSRFYNTVGWRREKEITEDARRWEDLRECAKDYVSRCRLRVFRYIPENGINMLDMASGPLQYEEYLVYSKNFKKRYCIDLSLAALEEAKEKIGSHGVFLHGSFFDIPLEENFFDCAISLHTIYHIDKDRQEEAVRKLIYATKPGKPVIIVYSNPNTVSSILLLPIRLLKKMRRLFKKPEKILMEKEANLYFYVHPVDWWNRFNDVADLKILPWRSFDSKIQKRLIPDSRIGKKMLGILFNLEERFPGFFAKNFQYPMIVITKLK